MYAVVKTGGKEYKFELGKVSTVEKLPGVVGDKIILEEVIFISDDGNLTMGNNFSVHCEIVKQFRDDKVIVFKKQRRTANFTRTKGHRQYLTSLLVKEISEN